jgi:hypothetical protein
MTSVSGLIRSIGLSPLGQTNQAHAFPLNKNPEFTG